MSKYFNSIINKVSSSSSNSKNKEILLFENIDNNLENWKLPSTPSSNVYKSKGTFNFSSDYVIKTIEDSIPLSQGIKSFNLLSKSLIDLHKQKYKFLHLGMIQVGLKPTTRDGLDTYALISVRDKRHKKFKDSLLGVVETSLMAGPVHFSCVPNLTLSLSDPTLLKALVLDLSTKGYDMDEETENLILVYRVHYKAMNTICGDIKHLPDKLDHSNPATMLFQTDLKSAVHVPRSIPWDEVNFPESWIIPQASEPSIKTEERLLTNIVNHPDGKAEVLFTPKSKSFRSSQSSQSSNRTFVTRSNLPSRRSVSSLIDNLDEVINLQKDSNEVYHPQYRSSASTEVKPKSPSPSDMGYSDHSVMVLSKPEFSPVIHELTVTLKCKAKYWFRHPKHAEKRDRKSVV